MPSRRYWRRFRSYRKEVTPAFALLRNQDPVQYQTYSVDGVKIAEGTIPWGLRWTEEQRIEYARPDGIGAVWSSSGWRLFDFVKGVEVGALSTQPRFPVFLSGEWYFARTLGDTDPCTGDNTPVWHDVNGNALGIAGNISAQNFYPARFTEALYGLTRTSAAGVIYVQTLPVDCSYQRYVVSRRTGIAVLDLIYLYDTNASIGEVFAFDGSTETKVWQMDLGTLLFWAQRGALHVLCNDRKVRRWMPGFGEISYWTVETWNTGVGVLSDVNLVIVFE